VPVDVGAADEDVDVDVVVAVFAVVATAEEVLEMTAEVVTEKVVCDTDDNGAAKEEAEVVAMGELGEMGDATAVEEGVALLDWVKMVFDVAEDDENATMVMATMDVVATEIVVDWAVVAETPLRDVNVGDGVLTVATEDAGESPRVEPDALEPTDAPVPVE
jgi:hypothetical protein